MSEKGVYKIFKNFRQLRRAKLKQKPPIPQLDVIQKPLGTYEIQSFEDSLAQTLFGSKKPKNKKQPWPALPPKITPTKAWYEDFFQNPDNAIQNYIQNQTRGYLPEIHTLQERAIIANAMQEYSLRKDMYPNSYKSFLWYYKLGIPIPDYFFEKDLTTIPMHSAVKHLTIPKRKTGGRDVTGQITVCHIGGGFRRRIRLVDTSRNFANPVTFIRYEHDPNRSSKIALVQDNVTKVLSYVLVPHGMVPGTVIDNKSKDLEPGTTVPLREIPNGTRIFNVEIHAGKGAQFVRSAGTHAVVVGRNKAEETVTVRLPSQKQCTLSDACTATIGTASNPEWCKRVIGKAGRNRNLGRRPTVRGVAMNAVDHPHGGGKGGRKKHKIEKSLWGKICK